MYRSLCFYKMESWQEKKVENPWCNVHVLGKIQHGSKMKGLLQGLNQWVRNCVLELIYSSAAYIQILSLKLHFAFMVH